MAGTITVGELLSDPTSSNKITIGSGTTLDLSSGAGSVTGAGKVLQVVSTTTNTAVGFAVTTWTDFINVSITPTSASSSILLIFSSEIESYRMATNANSGIRFEDNSGSVIGVSPESNLGGYIGGSTENAHRGYVTKTAIHSPSTTSAYNYKVAGRVANTANSANLQLSYGNSTSTLTLMEIGS